MENWFEKHKNIYFVHPEKCGSSIGTFIREAQTEIVSVEALYQAFKSRLIKEIGDETNLERFGVSG